MKRALMPATNLSDKAALSLGLSVIEGLTGNVNFPTPNPPLADVQAAYDAFTASVAKAKYGGRQDRADCRAAKALLIDLLRTLCTYVNYTADGDEQTLSGTGFPLSKTPQPRVLGVAQPSLEYGDNSGEMNSTTPAVEGAVGYKHQYTADPANGPWLEVVTSRSRCKLANLTPGTVYSSRIVAIGTGEQVTISEVVSKMAV